MNKFTNVFESAPDKTYEVAVETLIGEAKVLGTFTILEKTLSLAKEKVRTMLKEQKTPWLIKAVTEKENPA